MSNRLADSRYEQGDQALQFIMEQFVTHHVHTAAPGIIRRYDPATKRAEVQPALRIRIRDAAGERLRDRLPIIDVPVRQTAVGGHMVHQAIQPGDVVLLVFSQRGLEYFKQAWGELSDWPNGALFEERDAMAIPWGREDIEPVRPTGWLIQNESGETYLSVDDDTIRLVTDAGDSSVVVAPDSITVEKGGGRLEVTTSAINLTAPTITLTGNVQTTGALTNNGTNVGSTHRHGGVTIGTQSTGPPA